MDIVERLRDCQGDGALVGDMMNDAADEITILRGKNERLRAALRQFACKCSVKGMGAGGNCTRWSGECDLWNARAALEET